jgi:hypothetical protein
MAGTDGIDTNRIWTYRGYVAHAADGEIGKVEDQDTDAPHAGLLVVTGPWIFSKVVMLPVDSISHVDHEHQTIHVDATKQQIKNAPEYDVDTWRHDHTPDPDATAPTTRRA